MSCSVANEGELQVVQLAVGRHAHRRADVKRSVQSSSTNSHAARGGEDCSMAKAQWQMPNAAPGLVVRRHMAGVVYRRSPIKARPCRRHVGLAMGVAARVPTRRKPRAGAIGGLMCITAG